MSLTLVDIITLCLYQELIFVSYPGSYNHSMFVSGADIRLLPW